MANDDDNIEDFTPELKQKFAEYTLALIPILQALDNHDTQSYAENVTVGLSFISWVFAQLYTLDSKLSKNNGKILSDVYFEQETIAAMISQDPSYFDVAFNHEDDKDT